MIGYMAQRISGTWATVESLMGPGVDPHLYRPSESDVGRLERADLILYNGLNLEGKMGEVFEKLSRSRRVVAVAKEIPADLLRQPPEFQGHYDPHIWFDVSLWTRTIPPMVAALSAVAPERASDFQKNGEALAAELKELDAWVEREMVKVPEEQRVLVTAHDAFGYFGRRYKVDVVGLQGISTAEEFSIYDVERVVAVIVKRKVKSVFVESSVQPRTIEAVRKACEAQGNNVAIGGQLFSDAMGAAGSPEGTYPGMIRHNVRTILEALQ
jgi:manganese/zinc/iron transport system substrate-binding protein